MACNFPPVAQSDSEVPWAEACSAHIVVRKLFHGKDIHADTQRYEFYYDIICGGKFPFKLRELHAKYGPVVRITPDELSVSDPDFYAVLYTGPTRRRDKWKPVPGQKWVKESVAGSMSHEAHRMRRGALNPAFSTQRILSQHEMIDAKVDRFLERLDGFADSGETVLAWKVLGALTNGEQSMPSEHFAWLTQSKIQS